MALALFQQIGEKKIFSFVLNTRSQGLAEGYYQIITGKNVNTYARKNYANWCDPKGTGMIPVKYRVPGAAVFWGNSASSIHHIGYLEKPVKEGDTSGDWYIIEARGVNYGVVRTKLYDRKPNYWGWMTLYFEYPTEKAPEVDQPTYQLGDRALKPGMAGPDVKILQETLNSIGYNIKVDGIFGDKTEAAVLAFKKMYNIVTSEGKVNATYGTRAHEQLMKIVGDDEAPATEETTISNKKVRVYATGTWNVRKGPGATYEIVTIVKQDAVLPYVSTADNGWIQVETNGTTGWLSPRCAEVMTA